MRAYRIAGAVFFVAGTLSAYAGAQETFVQTYDGDIGQVIVEADSTEIYFADQLRVRYQVEAPSDTTVTFPTVADTLGPFRVVEHQASGPVSTGDSALLWRREFVLEANESGALSVPPFAFSFQGGEAGADGMSEHIRTQPIAVLVTAVVPDGADLTEPRDIARPLRAEPEIPDENISLGWIWWAAAVVAAIVVLEAILLWTRRRVRPTSDDGRRPIHEIARKALDRLRHGDFLDQHQFDTFYVALSGILRWYLQHRFGVEAPYRTTEEVVARARSDGLVSDHAPWLDAILQHSDAVKFARRQPTRDEATEVLDAIDNFVDRTADGTVLAPADTPLGQPCG